MYSLVMHRFGWPSASQWAMFTAIVMTHATVAHNQGMHEAQLQLCDVTLQEVMFLHPVQSLPGSCCLWDGNLVCPC